MYDADGLPLPPEAFGDCLDAGYGEKLFPCPWLTCRHHMAVYEDRDGKLQIEPIAIDRKGDVNLLRMQQTCSLRASKEGERSLAEIAEMLGITREGARQIALRATDRLKEELDDEFDEEPFAPLELPRDRQGRCIGDQEESL